MNLRLLIYMNPLVVDKIAKQFIYDKDSGFIFTRNLIANLPADWSYSVLVPPKVPREFFPADREVRLLPYNYSTSIHQNRYHFNREMLAQYSPYGVDYDIIINNQPEVSANLFAFFFNQRREKPIIINFFHWIDCKESREFARDLGGYIWRQIDGALAAEVNYFHTPYAKSLFDNELKRLGVTIDYKADYFSVNPTIFGTEPMELPDKKIILFNHRNNESTGWQEVLQAGIELRKERDDFIIWFTDDQKIDLNGTLNELDFVMVKRIPFENYGYVMQNAHFSVCNLQGYATWNLAVLDSIANGCFPLLRSTDLLRDLVKGLDAMGWGYFRHTDYDGLIYNMDIALDRSRESIHSLLSQRLYTAKPSTVEETITGLIAKRLDSKIPAKYIDVLHHIEFSGYPVLKKEWVNKFWSFHANGNFQKIRWRLLSQRIKDDITSVETKYFT